MQNPYSKTFLDIKFLFVNRFSNFFAAHFRTKGMLNHNKIIFVWGCFTARWYAKNLLLKDLAYGVVMFETNMYDRYCCILPDSNLKSHRKSWKKKTTKKNKQTKKKRQKQNKTTTKKKKKKKNNNIKIIVFRSLDTFDKMASAGKIERQRRHFR